MKDNKDLPYEKLVRKPVKMGFKKPSRTKQAFKAECDINNILNKYQKTQLLTHVNRQQGSYGDFSNVTDYQTALNTVIQAQEAFLGLPAKVRAKFQNDPSQFVQYVSDSSNYDEAIKLGLIDDQKAQAYLSQKAQQSQSLQNDDKTTNSGS